MTATGSYRRKKGLGITIMAGLAFASVGLAAPAQADSGQDQEFYRSLTRTNQDYPMVIWNFALVRSFGIASCQRMDAGETPYQALKDLQYPNGPYNFNIANDVSAAAGTIYCPWHDQGLQTNPDWATTPTPADWDPVYPPLAWSPSPHPLPDLPLHSAV
jgi:hypothetical protein